VVPVLGVPNLVGNASGIQKLKKGIDEQVEQKLEQDRALDSSRIQLNGRCVFPTHLYPHGGVVVDVLKQPDNWNPETLQYRPQTRLACGIKGVFEVEVYPYKCAIILHCLSC